ncbi:MAG: hypothetical protein H7274_10305 [Rhodoferax sp.]|nr:hypothetical protein [Rhodoferax sp.]
MKHDLITELAGVFLRSQASSFRRVLTTAAILGGVALVQRPNSTAR